MSGMPIHFGILGYIIPIVIITLSYAFVQTANNTSVMKDIPYDQRGMVSGMLSLSRNLGLITGGAVMGTIFIFAVGTSNITIAHSAAVAKGMQTTFIISAIIIALALMRLSKLKSQ